MAQIYKHEVQVTAEMMDRNGHVNNVAYVQWMQDAAVQHARTAGCLEASVAAGGIWVVRTHQIEYLSPTFAGDRITVLTWVANWRKVRSLRKYRMIRAPESEVVAEAQTDWVFVDAKTGRPRLITDQMKATLPIVDQDEEPNAA